MKKAQFLLYLGMFSLLASQLGQFRALFHPGGFSDGTY